MMNWNDQKIIEVENVKFLLIKDSDFGDLKLVRDSDAVIIFHSQNVLTEFLMENIRRDEGEDIYLKPVFVYSKTGEDLDQFRLLSDGRINNLDSALYELRNQVLRIREKLLKLDSIKPLNFESYVINKMLRFFYIRDIKNFSPVSDRKVKLGYSFPFLSQHFNISEERNILDLLQLAEDEGYLIGEHLESVYLCNHCFNSYLFYREVCSKCESSDLKQEDLIHHFPCAYIGPISDFTDQLRKNDLTCPKCDKHLKHIGVDYDKPSLIYTCNSCSHVFQDVSIKAKCCECQKDTEVEHLLHRSVKKYQVTQKGYFTAQYGIASTQKDISVIPGTVNMDTFKIMLQYEIERMKIAQIESNLGYLHINNAMDLYPKVGNDSKLNLLSDLVQIIRSSIRSSDVVAFENMTTLLFSLTESKRDEADKIVRKISIMIRKLIRDNFDGFQAEIVYKVHPISKGISHIEQLKELTAGKEIVTV